MGIELYRHTELIVYGTRFPFLVSERVNVFSVLIHFSPFKPITTDFLLSRLPNMTSPVISIPVSPSTHETGEEKGQERKESKKETKTTQRGAGEWDRGISPCKNQKGKGIRYLPKLSPFFITHLNTPSTPHLQAGVYLGE